MRKSESACFQQASRRLRVIGVASVLVIAGCSGGNSEPGLQLHDAPVPLATKTDVVRELRIVNYFVTYGDGEAQYTPPFGSSKAGLDRSAWLAKARSKAEAVACESGSGSSAEGSKQRTFELYGVSRQVDYTVGTFSACRRTDTPGVDSITFDGVLESGDSTSGDYSYLLAGDGRSPSLMTFQQDGATFHQGVLGLSESRISSTLYEERKRMTFNFDHDGGSVILGEFGHSGEPFVETDGGGRYTVNGPYRYVSTECVGGSVDITTDSPLVVEQGYPRGGALRFSSGVVSATVVVRSDSSATIQFSDGTTGSISGNEMRQIYDDFETECVLNRFE